jgi:hypothetical protein
MTLVSNFLKSVCSVFFVLTLICPANSVQAETKDEKCFEKAEHEQATFFLVDRTDKLENEDGFKKTIAALKDMVQSGERVVVGVSTDRASQTRLLMDFVRPKKSLWVSKLKIRALENRFNECLEGVLTDLVSTEEEHKHSALLETLSFVSKVLKRDPSKSKRLVLYSDMMQNSTALSFFSMKPFNPTTALSRVEKEKLLFQFPSVEVFAAGTGANISDQQARELESFWGEYFRKAGGELAFYGPILVNY